MADIGDIPAVVNPERREACRYDLFLFLTTYFPKSTGLKPFSDDHRRVIDRIQRCIVHGGRFVNAVYRGFAKTTVSENSAIWATVYGHRKFVPIFGADQGAADGNIDSIKRELDSNDLLLEDFPEVCYPIRCLEGKPQRQHSQTHKGRLTHVGWTADTVVLPTIAGSLASGAILCAHGLTGSNRGLKFKRPDGTQQRPDFVIIDDPQTDESAHSQLQVRKRLNTIKKTILKLGGHGKSLAVVMNATVIAPDDLVDQFLDTKKNAAWQGERIKMVRKWADAHETLWLKDYNELRSTYDKDNPEAQKQAHAAATEFYRQHRDEMDRGCVVSWEHCYDEEVELSAIQHAYNALIDDGPEVFASEFQNEPLPDHPNSIVLLTADEIAQKVNGFQQSDVPLECQRLTAFIDVHDEVLYYVVCGWADGFTGYVLDYGTYPDQKVDHFHLREARYRLTDIHRGSGTEGAIFAGLQHLTSQLLAREWTRGDQAAMRIERCLVDSGHETNVILDMCRQSPHAGVLLPSKGTYVGARSQPFNNFKRKPGELRGLEWRIPPLASGKPVRHCLYNTNFWKSFIHKRLATSLGDRGCLTLFKAPPYKHRMLAEHLRAEYCVTTSGWGRTLEEWQQRPNKPDNHFFDCIVGCAVAASIQGISLECQKTKAPVAKKRRQKVTYF